MDSAQFPRSIVSQDRGYLRSGPFPRFTAASIAFAVCLALAGCRTSSSTARATIAFNTVPATGQAAQGQEVPDQTGTIEGYATGVRPGEHIVVYSKTDGRWGLRVGV